MKRIKKILLYSILSIVTILIILFAPVLFGTRQLSEAELLISKNIFGSNIDHKKVRINIGGPLTWIYPAVTIGHTISFPKNNYNPDNVKDQALFIHEMTHVWQYENIGFIYAPRSLYEEISQKNAYVVHYDEKKAFIEYDLEEQAEIMAEYHLTKNPIYQKYIDSL